MSIKTKQHSYTAILTNYNHSRFLPEVIKTITEQTIPFDEFIIIDDKSTDNSVEIIAGLIKNIPNAKFLRNEKNMGVEKTLNRGLSEAKSEFIVPLSADDIFSFRIIELCEQALLKYPDVSVIAGNTVMFDSMTGKEMQFTLPFPQEVAAYDANDIARIAKKRHITFFGGATIMKRSAMLEAGGYLESLKWHSDWLLYLIIAYRGKFAVIPENIVKSRLDGGQYSQSCNIWSRQAPVIREIIMTLQNKYGDAFEFFKENALFPKYNPRAIWFILSDKNLRKYMTPLLAWRLLTYNLFRSFGKIMPSKLKNNLRTLLKV